MAKTYLMINNAQNKMSSVAWLLMGLTGSIPGILKFNADNLSYIAYGSGVLTKGQLRTLERITQVPNLKERLLNGENVKLFEVSVESITKITYPWYYFNGGMVISINHNNYRFSFLQPQNTKMSPNEMKELSNIMSDVKNGWDIGKTWREVLRSKP